MKKAEKRQRVLTAEARLALLDLSEQSSLDREMICELYLLVYSLIMASDDPRFSALKKHIPGVTEKLDKVFADLVENRERSAPEYEAIRREYRELLSESDVPEAPDDLLSEIFQTLSRISQFQQSIVSRLFPLELAASFRLRAGDKAAAKDENRESRTQREKREDG